MEKKIIKGIKAEFKNFLLEIGVKTEDLSLELEDKIADWWINKKKEGLTH